MLFRTAVLALVVLLSSVFSLAQRSPLYQRQTQPLAQGQDDSSLTGNVFTSDNKPLKDARVELRDGTGLVVTSVYTNSSGSFEFLHVHIGLYEVVATAGLEESRERLEVTGLPSFVSLRIAGQKTPVDGGTRNSVSVAQYKVPNKAREEFKKAQEAASKQKHEDAQNHLEKALAIYPAYADAFTLRGILKLDKRDEQGAIADLQKAIESDGNYALAYIVMGAAQNINSKFDEAIRALERGQTLAPTSWQAYFEMGKALAGKAQYEKALVQLDRAQTLAPHDYPLIHLVKAHAMLALNSYSDAMTELQSYLEKEPNGPNSQQAQKMLEQARTFAAVKQTK
jgi:tetratricopeptide (TPR) repeat protein